MPEAVYKLRKKAAHSRSDGQACFYEDFGEKIQSCSLTILVNTTSMIILHMVILTKKNCL
jgi:hypothetical protein